MATTRTAGVERIAEKTDQTGLWCVRSGLFIGWVRHDGRTAPMWWRDGGQEMVWASYRGGPRAPVFFQEGDDALRLAVANGGGTPWHILPPDVPEWIGWQSCYVGLEDGMYFCEVEENESLQ